MTINPKTGNTSGAERAAERARYAAKADTRGCPWCGCAGKYTIRRLPVPSRDDMECLKCGVFYCSSASLEAANNSKAAWRAVVVPAFSFPFVPDSFRGHAVHVIGRRTKIPKANIVVEFACDRTREKVLMQKQLNKTPIKCIVCRDRMKVDAAQVVAAFDRMADLYCGVCGGSWKHEHDKAGACLRESL
jgi:transcription elongation factor Elf1